MAAVASPSPNRSPSLTKCLDGEVSVVAAAVIMGGEGADVADVADLSSLAALKAVLEEFLRRKSPPLEDDDDPRLVISNDDSLIV